MSLTKSSKYILIFAAALVLFAIPVFAHAYVANSYDVYWGGYPWGFGYPCSTTPDIAWYGGYGVYGHWTCPPIYTYPDAHPITPANQTIACSADSQCGYTGPTGSASCQGNDVYQQYTAGTCVNPGSYLSFCTTTTTSKLLESCGYAQTCSNGNCISACTPNFQQKCSGNNLYWYDSCNVQGGLIQYCSNGCSGNSCIVNNCSDHASQRCNGNYLYWYDSCGNQQDIAQYCSNGCSGNTCISSTNTCSYHSYERCNGSYLYWYDSCGNQQDIGQYCPNGCVNNYCQTQTYVAPPVTYSGTLNVSKTVKNLTTGSNFATAVYASPSDTLMFMITLQANGGDTQNVSIRDALPGNLIYGNQLIVACTGSTNCNSYGNSGNIVTGVNLGTIYNSQTVTVTYQAQLADVQNFTYGTSTLTDDTYTTSSSSGYIPTASASVVVTRSTVLGASTISTGLTNNFWLDSFIIPLLITIIIIWLWRAGMFIGIERWIDSKRKVQHGYRTEKELSQKIDKIKKYGKT